MDFNENNFYTKLIDIIEIYNFVILGFFYLKSLRCSKNLITYPVLRVFLTFHLRFDTVKAKSDGDDMKSKKV